MKKNLLPYLISLCVWSMAFVSPLLAQQDAQYSMYRFNGLYLNPAYSGSHEVLSAMAVYRHQWVNVPGMPQSASVALHSPLKNDKLALGFIYNLDKLGVIQQNSIKASFAYRLPLGKQKKIRLCFGISAGVTNYRADFSRVAVTDAGDPNFEGDNITRWLPDVGLGVYAYSDRFFAGISVPQILVNNLNGKHTMFETSTSVARQYHHLLITGGYVFSLGKKVKFAPSVLLKYVPVHAPLSFDCNAMFVFIDRVWLGAAYRFTDSYNFLLAVNVTRQLKIGYAYDLTVSRMNQYTSGSHEVMASFDFDFRHHKVVSPRRVKYF